MLQLKTAGLKALDNLRSAGLYPPPWQSMAELEKITDDTVARFLSERYEVSKELGGGFLLPELLDRTVRTTESEHMDDRNMPEQKKLELVQALDRQNTLMHLYPRYISILQPLIHETAKRQERPVRLLELASGSGGLALALAKEVRQKKLPLSVTASDVIPAYIEQGNHMATQKNLPVTFRHLNALNLQEIGAAEFDIIIISQSLHHFTPGQLAVMIAQSAQHTTTAFIGIDGYRSIVLACGVPLMASLQGIASFTLDGLTSARKFYSELELDMITEIATAKRDHAVSSAWPLSVLSIRFDGEKPG